MIFGNRVRKNGQKLKNSMGGVVSVFIKELFDYGVSLERELRSLRSEGKTDDSYFEDLNEKFRLLRETLTFIYRGSWLKKESARTRLRTIMDARFDYARVADELVTTRSERGARKVNALRSFMTYISKGVESLLGSDFLDLVKQGRLSDAYMRLNLVRGRVSLDTVLLKGASELLPKDGVANTYRVLDCKAELEMLRNLSVYYFQHYILPTIDANKLAFLRSLLDNDDPVFMDERVAVFKFLSGELKDLRALEVYLEDRLGPTVNGGM